MKRYFAYGSNMSEEQMAEPRRAPDAQKVGVAELSNYEFFIIGQRGENTDCKNKDGGVASIREAMGKTVWGVIYEISEEDERKLDVREGFPNCYTKIDLPELDAFSYIDQTIESGKTRDGYLGKIIKAALNNHFPFEYIEELRGWSNRVPEERDCCTKCGTEGTYEMQDGLCDFCFTTENNSGQGVTSMSQEEIEEAEFDDYLKIAEESNDNE